MMIRYAVVLAVVTACGGKPPPAPVISVAPPEVSHARPPDPPPEASAPAPDVVAPPVVVPPAFRRVEAPPAGAITLVATSPDGTAALTADELGGVRLWPALDGSAEPVIVDLPPPLGLAVSRTADRFMAAMLDDAGGLEVATLDRDGRIERHAAIALADGDAAYTGLAIGGADVLAWSARALVIADGDGAVRSRLAAPAGGRIVAAARSGDHAAAVVEVGGVRRTRELVLAPLAWGDAIKGSDGLTSIALSPGGDRLAGITGARVVAIEIAGGRRLAAAPVRGDTRIGFVDDAHVAIAGRDGQLAWLRLDPLGPHGAPRAAAGPALAPIKPSPAQPALLAVGGGRAVTVRGGGDLVLATPGGVTYLGYRIAGLITTAPAPGGQLLVGSDDRWAVLDGRLELTGAAPKLAAPSGHQTMSVASLGGDDWLLEASRNGARDLYLADSARGTTALVRSRPTYTYVTMTPGSPLVALSTDPPEVDRYVPDRHALEKVALPIENGTRRIYPTVPRLAGGTQLVALSYDDDREHGKLRWIHDLEHPDRGGAELVLHDLSVLAVDASGRVYADEVDRDGGHRLARYRDGQRLDDTALSAGASIVPAPSATRYAMLADGNLELDSADGKRQWVTAGLRGSLIWLDDDHLVLDIHQGLASIDVATGVASGARCGWRFGLSSTPNLGTPAMASLCTQASVGRGDGFEAPGDAGFKAIVTDVAAASAGSIAEWGSAPIGGAMRRFAVIVVSQGQMDMTTMVGYLVEISPGAYVEAIFHGWGFVQPSYDGLPETPAWTVGAAATAARQDRWGNPISKYHNGDFAFETRWIHMSGEEFSFTIRNGTFVVALWDWTEHERDNGRMTSTGDRKIYSETGSCSAGCPKLATHKTHAASISVLGPTGDPAALTVLPGPGWK